MAEAAGWRCETVIASIREPSDFAGLPIVADGAGAGTEHGSRSPHRSWAVALARCGRRGRVLRRDLDRATGSPGSAPAGGARADGRRPDAPRGASRWSPPPTPPSRPPTAGSSHRHWRTASATSIGRSTPARSQTGFSEGWPTPEPRSLAAGWERRIPVSRSWVAGFLTVRPTLALAVPEDARRRGTGVAEPAHLGHGRATAGRRRAQRRWRARVLAARPRLRRRGRRRRVPDLARRGGPPRPGGRARRPRELRAAQRGDRAYAALSSIAAAVAGDPTDGRWERGWRAFARAAEAAPDVAAAAARTLARCRPPGAAIPPEVNAFAPLLRDAGLLGVSAAALDARKLAAARLWASSHGCPTSPAPSSRVVSGRA